jgi:hypothetical protein
MAEGGDEQKASVGAPAVFISCASQDAAATTRICTALRQAGIEVWFDQSELRGGDVWDQRIRRESRDCTLFRPVISANTASRNEGYFRPELGSCGSAPPDDCPRPGVHRAGVPGRDSGSKGGRSEVLPSSSAVDTPARRRDSTGVRRAYRTPAIC